MLRKSRDRAAPIGLVALAILAAACTRRVETGASRFALDGMPPQLPSTIAPEVLSDRAARAGVDADVVPLGVLQSDGISPPVIAPDGRFVAVQRAPAPGWIDLVAWRPEMPRPAPAIALVPIGEDALGTPIVPGEPLLLGRGADAEGVLVEGPLPDGSRRIGRASWRTGEVEWLVEDEGVAAMATLGPSGELAWCRSERAGEPASLRLLRPDGRLREWPPLPESTWMLPAFSGDGGHLFALLLEDGRATLAAFDLDDPSAAAGSWIFSNRIDARVALQSVLTVGPDASPPGEVSWLLFHPEWNALCRWHPTEGRIDRLPSGTYTLTRRLDAGRLLADDGGLWHVGGSAGDVPERLDLLLEGVWVPRVVDRPSERGGSVLLFSPGPAGLQVIRLSIRRPPEASDETSPESLGSPASTVVNR